MAKHIFLALLFCAFFLGFNENLSANILKNIENQPINQDLCTLPPPDNFRIASLSPNAVTLAWNPIGSGLTHQIKVYKKVSIGDWILVNTVNNAPGTEITINGLDLSIEHRATIATNCSENDPSELVSIVDHIALILDLTLAGRTPINPSALDNCTEINYEVNNWVGFSITAPATAGQVPKVKFFEADEIISSLGELSPAIKRTDNSWLLVATDADKQFPIFPFPTVVEIQGSYDFKIFDWSFFPTPRFIGNVSVTDFSSTDNTIKICKINDGLWDPKYQFNLLKADNAFLFSEDEDSRDEKNSDGPKIEKNEILVQSPFSDFLTILLPQGTGGENCSVQLINFSGQPLTFSHFENVQREIILPTQNLPSGLYIIRVEIKGKTVTLRAFKSY